MPPGDTDKLERGRTHWIVPILAGAALTVSGGLGLGAINLRERVLTLENANARARIEKLEERAAAADLRNERIEASLAGIEKSLNRIEAALPAPMPLPRAR